ncbi:MAG: Rho termination factor N-terminal domain-containing protein [Bacillota bacterium]
MKKLITKYPIPNIILGIILIAFAVYATFIEDIMYDSIIYIVGFIIAIYAVLKLYKDIRYVKKQITKILMGLEFVLTIALTILLVTDIMSLAIVLGLVLYIRGANFLLILQVNKMATSVKRYLVNLVLITLGAYLFIANDAYTDILQYILFVLITLYGILLLYFGIANLIKMSKEKNGIDKRMVEEQSIKSTSTQSHYNYTKSALKEKTVDTLKQMCKERGLKGYSTLSKDELVERLWLYEKEE